MRPKLSSALKIWREIAVEQKRQQTLMRHAHLWWMHSMPQPALNTWREIAVKQKEQQMLMRAAREEWMRQKLPAVLSTWRKIASNEWIKMGSRRLQSFK